MERKLRAWLAAVDERKCCLRRFQTEMNQRPPKNGHMCPEAVQPSQLIKYSRASFERSLVCERKLATQEEWPSERMAYENEIEANFAFNF